ncbi:MAG: response regulator [Acidobacteriota bacterium]
MLETETVNSSLEQARILIVDDERSVCSSVEKVLNRQGYRTSTALSVSKALEILQGNNDFSLIITDLMMPKVNGMELLKIARSSWPNIPVLVITGYPSIASAVEATQLGAANYLAKPFTPEELQSAVMQALTPKPTDRVDTDPGRCGQETESGSIDVDLPFSYAEVAAATSSAYADALGRSDLPVVGHWTKEGRGGDGPTVLVIDDEVIVVNSVRRILSRKGYRVESAFTGREALQRISEQDYSLALLDMRLPDWDGLKLLSHIKRIKPDMPVLVVTGYASIETAVEAVQRGASDYMAKPFTPEELYQFTSRTLSRYPWRRGPA